MYGSILTWLLSNIAAFLFSISFSRHLLISLFMDCFDCVILDSIEYSNDAALGGVLQQKNNIK